MRKTALLMILCTFISLFANIHTVNADTSASTNLEATIRVSGAMSYITLDWNTENAGTSSDYYYRIERKSGKDEFEEIDKFRTATQNSFTDIMTDPDMGKAFSYRIAIYDASYKFLRYSNTISFVLKENSQPSNVVATSVDGKKIKLTWDFLNGAPLSTMIERKAEGADKDNNTWVQIGGTNGSTNSFEDSNIEAGVQYTYRLRCALGSECYSPYVESNTVNSGLVMPKDFTVSLVSKNSVLLEWNNIWSEDVEIHIERKVNNGEFTALKTLTDKEGAYFDEDLIEGNSYTYRIRAQVNYSSITPYSPWSEEITVIAIDIPAPSGLSVTATSSTTVDLTWQDNSNDESGFEIWRRNGDGTAWTKYAIVLANVHKFSDKNLSPSTIYSYKVRAFSNAANAASTFTPEIVSKTIVPTAKVVLDYSCANNIPTLRWNILGTIENESVLQLERKGEYDVEWSALPTVSVSAKYYTDTVLEPYTRYSYRMKVINTENNSASYSDILEFAAGIPKAPDNLVLTAMGSNTVKLTWNDESMNAESFIIERNVAGSGFKELAKVPSGQTSYIDNLLTPGKLYTYRVSAYNKSGASDASNTKSFTPKSPTVFYDMGDNGWALEAVLNLADIGVLSGTSQGYFSPEAKISRAEFTSMAVKALKLKKQHTTNFADVKPADWFYDDLLTAKSYGIISGTNEGYFYPDSSITREDMSVILCKALSAANKPLAGKNTSILDNYSDRYEISNYSLSYFSSMKAAGLINGKDGNRLAPKDFLTRAEAAAIIWRVLSNNT